VPAGPQGSERPDAEAPGGVLPSFGVIAEAVELCCGFSVFATDLGGVVKLWSEGAQRLYGYARSEIVGQPMRKLDSDEDSLPDVSQEILDTTLRVGSWEGPVRRRRRDGGRFTAHVWVTPFREGDDSPTGFLFVSRDISGEELLRDALDLERRSRRVLFDASADAMVTADAAGVIRRANAAAERLFGYGQAELIGRPVEMLMPAGVRDGHAQYRTAFAAAPHSRAMAAGLNIVGQRKDGTEVALEIRLTPHDTDSGHMVTAEIRDVTEQRRIERELVDAHRQAAESLALLETLQASAPVGFGFVDRDFRIRTVNPGLAAIQGGQPDELIGRRVADALPHLWAQIEPMYKQILDTGEPILNVSAQGTDAGHPGQLRSWLASYYPVTVDGKVIGIGQVVVDITDRRQADEFRAAVMQTMAEGLCVMDGDGRLILMNPAATNILGWTQDELHGKSVHAAIHFQHADRTPYPEDECELRALRVEGTEALVGEDAFTAKDGRIIPVSYSASPLVDGSRARGVVVVFRDMTEAHAERERARLELEALTWVGRIRDALDEDRLVLYSQPIVPLTGGEPREELLVRMIGRNGELIPPGTFLPAAEQYGLIGDIDRWVIGQAIVLAADGRTVHVNLSAQSVADRGLLASIERQLHQAGADPGNLVFELTETALMDDINTGERFAHGLAELGCAVALDDFGTGFGSFTYLKRLPVKVVKIDIEFVRNLTTNTSDQHLVKAMVNLAQGFGQQTVAEGVEDAQTLELLRGYGVDYAQGFHLGRPADRS
jgi:PAS domain S-box-containing protein